MSRRAYSLLIPKNGLKNYLPFFKAKREGRRETRPGESASFFPVGLKTVWCVAWAAALLWLTGCGSPQSTSKDTSTESNETASSQATGNGSSAGGSGKLPATTVDDLLKRMVDTYRKASTYADRGTATLAIEPDQEGISTTVPYSLTVERPNKARLEVAGAVVVSNGQKAYAAINDIPGQVVARDAPEKLSTSWLYGPRNMPVQSFMPPSQRVVMLLDDNALEAIQYRASEKALIEPGTIEGKTFYRVQLTRPEGVVVFWIDPQSYALRRVEFPTEAMRAELEGYLKHKLDKIHLVADFTDAQFNKPVDPVAFQFAMPKGARQVAMFTPPSPADLLGQPVPDFQFTQLDGTPVTRESLKGKIVVLAFWATWCTPCHENMPRVNEVAEAFKDNDKVVFYAVNIQGEQEADNAKIEQTAEQWGIQMSLLRDTQQAMPQVFRTQNVPTTLVLDGQGVLQDWIEGLHPKTTTRLEDDIQQLIEGKDTFEVAAEEYGQKLKQVEEQLKQAEAAVSDGAMVEEHELPQAAIAEQSEPKTFKLTQAFKCDELKAPGNVVVVDTADGTPRLLVIDGWKSVAEVDLDGKLIATHPVPGLADMEFINTLRTTVDAQGNRYYAVFTMLGQQEQRFHLLDEQWNLLFNHPEDALENRHAGISDVELGDLNGDGTPEAYVSYWDVIGVKGVSLKGEVLWSNRSIADIPRMAIGLPDAQGQRLLFCIDQNGGLTGFDAEGKRAAVVQVPDTRLNWVAIADLTDDEQEQFCGQTAKKLGEMTVVGFNRQGKLLWSYPMPPGIPQLPAEPISVGQIHENGPKQWILPGADGSLHFIAADGTPLDKFNYGQPIGGVATTKHNDQTLLIVSSSRGLEGWRVE